MYTISNVILISTFLLHPDYPSSHTIAPSYGLLGYAVYDFSAHPVLVSLVVVVPHRWSPHCLEGVNRFLNFTPNQSQLKTYYYLN
jgi:hypothetical protein